LFLYKWGWPLLAAFFVSILFFNITFFPKIKPQGNAGMMIQIIPSVIFVLALISYVMFFNYKRREISKNAWESSKAELIRSVFGAKRVGIKFEFINPSFDDEYASIISLDQKIKVVIKLRDAYTSLHIKNRFFTKPFLIFSSDSFNKKYTVMGDINPDKLISDIMVSSGKIFSEVYIYAGELNLLICWSPGSEDLVYKKLQEAKKIQELVR
jgi:hypothetical protein